MNRDLFEDVVSPSIHVGEHSWYSMPLSVLSHAAVVAVLVVVPLTATNVLPTPETVLVFVTPPASPPAPPPPVVMATPVAELRTVTVANPDAAPLEAPDRLVEPPAVVQAAPPNIPALRTAVSREPPVVRPQSDNPITLATPPPARPLPVGGNVREPERLHYVPPTYPTIARAARQQGTVILEATIGTDGRVIDARVLRSHDLFDAAAITAVRQWRYAPSTLNGIPIAVTMTVTVHFRLQ